MCGFNLASSSVFGFARVDFENGPTKNSIERRKRSKSTGIECECLHYIVIGILIYSFIRPNRSYSLSRLLSANICFLTTNIRGSDSLWGTSSDLERVLAYEQTALNPFILLRYWACPVSNCSVLVIEWGGYNFELCTFKRAFPNTWFVFSGNTASLSRWSSAYNNWKQMLWKEKAPGRSYLFIQCCLSRCQRPKLGPFIVSFFPSLLFFVQGQFGSETIFNSIHLAVETFVQGWLGYLEALFEGLFSVCLLSAHRKEVWVSSGSIFQVSDFLDPALMC